MSSPVLLPPLAPEGMKRRKTSSTHSWHSRVLRDAKVPKMKARHCGTHSNNPNAGRSFLARTNRPTNIGGHWRRFWHTHKIGRSKSARQTESECRRCQSFASNFKPLAHFSRTGCPQYPRLHRIFKHGTFLFHNLFPKSSNKTLLIPL